MNKIYPINRNKLIFARMMSRCSLDRMLLWFQRAIFKGHYIRAVNYHDTPPSTTDNFEKHLQFYRQHFSPVSYEDLDFFFERKKWPKDKPGLIISFDDGLRTNYDVAKPILRKYGFTGWFFVPTEFVDSPFMAQRKFASDHQIRYEDVYEDGRIAMSWEELRKLYKNHVIGCHTKTHYRMDESTSEEKMNAEIIQAKHILEEKLQHEVHIFCWVGGEEYTYTSNAAQCICKAGYRYAFMTNCTPILTGTNRLQLQRTNIESSWPLELVSFQLSGFMDIPYIPKRRRVNKITTTSNRL